MHPIYSPCAYLETTGSHLKSVGFKSEIQTQWFKRENYETRHLFAAMDFKEIEPKAFQRRSTTVSKK